MSEGNPPVTNFADRVVEAVREKNSCVVVGLDPRPDWLPAEFGLSGDLGGGGRQRGQGGDGMDEARAAEAVLEFNRRVIRVVAPLAVAVKPQVAFYEQLGWRGVKAYEDTIALARAAGLLVIADVKRGDIGETAEAYAAAHLGKAQADAATVNPYLGSDSVQPFTKFCARGKGIFVLVKTSNPSSSELQDWPGDGRAVWRRVAELVGNWGREWLGASGYSAVGAVVGATFPRVAAELRQALPHALFLLPGYGVQGADAEACRACFDGEGLGALVSSSRGVIFAYRSAAGGEANWEAAVGAAAAEMRDSLNKVRMGPSPGRGR